MSVRHKPRTGEQAAYGAMHLAINGRFLGQELSGVQRYGREAIGALDGLLARGGYPCGGEPTIFVPPHVPKEAWPDKLDAFTVRPAGRLSGHAWEQIELPWHARRSVLINLTNSAPVMQAKQVVAIHDAAIRVYPDDFRWQYRVWYSSLYAALRRSGARFITVSAFAAGEIERRFGIPPESIAVIPNAAEHIALVPPDPDVLHRLGLRPFGYVLAVGKRSLRKNLQLAEAGLSAVPEPRPRLVVVGGGAAARGFSPSAPGPSQNSIHLGQIPEAALRALYEKALCLVFPSRYEGFGLPPLEAMACGCPVIAARAGSLPEVCGDAALYCDPDQPQSVTQAILALMSDGALRNRLVAAGFERSRSFSWHRSAEALLAVAMQFGASEVRR